MSILRKLTLHVCQRVGLLTSVRYDGAEQLVRRRATWPDVGLRRRPDIIGRRLLVLNVLVGGRYRSRTPSSGVVIVAFGST